MGITSNTLNEDEYYHSSIMGRRSYYSDGLHLALVHNRFTSQKNRTIDEYRLYLNLFAYQFIVAIETDCKELSRIDDADAFYPQIEALSAHVESLFKRFRRSEPEDPKRQSYFENADNYLSWFGEQQLLKLLAYAPRSSEYAAVTEKLLLLCRNENKYRQERSYNSSNTLQDPNRIANKMLLLRRLIQRGVVLKEELKTLGTGLKKFSTGLATALVMIVVSSLILKAQGVFSGLTIALILTLAVIYGFREIFKDDVRNAMWRYLQRGRPRWSRLLRDTTSGAVIAKQQVWLEFMRSQDIPKGVARALKRRHRENNVETEVLHYGLNTKVASQQFLSGYSTIQEQVNFSLAPFARYLERGKAKIYKEQDGKVSNDSVERRYQINLILLVQDDKQAPQYMRYKITLNRSSIVDITEAELPDELTS